MNKLEELKELIKIFDEVPVTTRDAMVIIDDLQSRLDDAVKVIEFMMQTKFSSIDKDNMEFEGRFTCFQLEKAKQFLKQQEKPE